MPDQRFLINRTAFPRKWTGFSLVGGFFSVFASRGGGSGPCGRPFGSRRAQAAAMRRWWKRKKSKGTMIVPLDPCGFFAGAGGVSGRGFLGDFRRLGAVRRGAGGNWSGIFGNRPARRQKFRQLAASGLTACGLFVSSRTFGAQDRRLPVGRSACSRQSMMPTGRHAGGGRWVLPRRPVTALTHRQDARRSRTRSPS